MLTHADLSAWVEIQDGLARAAESRYERLRKEIVEQIGGCREGR